MAAAFNRPKVELCLLYTTGLELDTNASCCTQYCIQYCIVFNISVFGGILCRCYCSADRPNDVNFI